MTPTTSPDRWEARDGGWPRRGRCAARCCASSARRPRQQAIDSLKAQLRDADAAIGRDASALNGLHNQVSYSRVGVTIQAADVPVPVSHGGGGFTLHRALRDAGHVLVVVAGVALIALAVLIPLGLVVGLVAWTWLAIRRRRREAMLDLV